MVCGIGHVLVRTLFLFEVPPPQHDGEDDRKEQYETGTLLGCLDLGARRVHQQACRVQLRETEREEAPLALQVLAVAEARGDSEREQLQRAQRRCKGRERRSRGTTPHCAWERTRWQHARESIEPT